MKDIIKRSMSEYDEGYEAGMKKGYKKCFQIFDERYKKLLIRQRALEKVVKITKVLNK